MIDFDCQKDEHAHSAIDFSPQLRLGEIVMACEHPTLILAERTIYKDNILVSDVDVIMCPECGYFALARMKKKELKKAKKVAALPQKRKPAPPKSQVTKAQQSDNNKLNQALKTELGKLGVTPRKTYGADNTAKPSGGNNPPVKVDPNSAQAGNPPSKTQGITPLKTEGKKTKKK